MDIEYTLNDVKQISSIRRTEDGVVMLIQYGKDTLKLILNTDHVISLWFSLDRAKMLANLRQLKGERTDRMKRGGIA